jgi:hypothetical protein
MGGEDELTSSDEDNPSELVTRQDLEVLANLQVTHDESRLAQMMGVDLHSVSARIDDLYQRGYVFEDGTLTVKGLNVVNLAANQGRLRKRIVPPELMQSEGGETGLRRMMFLTGGAGVILWGIATLVLLSSLGVLTLHDLVTTSASSRSVGTVLTFTDAAMVLFLYLYAAVLMIVAGARLVGRKFSWGVYYALVVVLSFAGILISLLLLTNGGLVGYGVVMFCSSAFAIVGASIARGRPVAAKLTGIGLGTLAAILFYYSLDGPLSLFSTTAGTYDVANVTLVTIGFEMIAVALIVALLISFAVQFLGRAARLKYVFFTLISSSPLLMGLGLSLGSFGLVSSLVSNSGLYYQGSSAPVAAVYWIAVTCCVLAGIGGALIFVSSAFGFGYGATLLGPGMILETPGGAPVQAAEPAYASTPSVGSFCPKCGSKLMGDELFCRFCGARL